MARIKVDHTKCYGCGACEVACSLKHTGTVNPKRSRVRVFPVEHLFIPVFAGPFTEAKCSNRRILNFGGVEVDGCILCSASCPVKPVFKEPDLDIALKCDLCGEPPDPECCKACLSGALTFIEDEDDEESESAGDSEKTGDK